MTEVGFNDFASFGSIEKGRIGEAIAETYLQTAIQSTPTLVFDDADEAERVRIIARDGRDLITFREIALEGEQSQVRWRPDSQFEVHHNGMEVEMFMEVKTGSKNYPGKDQRRVMARMCQNPDPLLMLCSVEFQKNSAELEYRQLVPSDEGAEWVKWTFD